MRNPWLLPSMLLATTSRPHNNNNNNNSPNNNRMMSPSMLASYYQQVEPVVYQVCLSKACLAQGAKDTLERMQALAPPHVTVEATTTCISPSLCDGDGPVVLEKPLSEAEGSTISDEDDLKPIIPHCQIAGDDKLLNLLYQPPLERIGPSPLERLQHQEYYTADNPDDEEDDDEDLNKPLQPLNDVQVMLRERKLREREERRQQREQRRRQQQEEYARRQANHFAETPRQNNNNNNNVLYQPPEALVKGYNLVLKADALFADEEYERAVVLYEQAVTVAFNTAMEFQRIRDSLQHQYHPTTSTAAATAAATITNAASPTAAATATSATTRAPAALAWLIRARRQEAVCKLQLPDQYHLEDAMFAAQAAANLSRNTDADSSRVMADIYQRKGDLLGERQALQNMLSQLVIQEQQQQQQQSSNAAAGTGGTNSRNNQKSTTMTRSIFLSTQVESQQRLVKLRLEKVERELKRQQKNLVQKSNTAVAAKNNRKNGSENEENTTGELIVDNALVEEEDEDEGNDGVTPPNRNGAARKKR